MPERVIAHLAILLAVAAAPPLRANENLWTFLPTRVLEVDGRSITFQAAVILETRQPLTNPLLQKYPTRYLLVATNESSDPLWIEAEWRVPGEKPFASVGKLEPGAFGEFHANVKKIAWNTPIPVAISVFADQSKRRRLGGRDVVLSFSEEDRVAFEASANEINSRGGRLSAATRGLPGAKLPLVPGFQEMDLTKAVPGTKADAPRVEEAKLQIWKFQSRRHWDCSHDVSGARELDPSQSAVWERLPIDVRGRLEAARTSGPKTLELWDVTSCQSTATYLVAWVEGSPKGATVIVAEVPGQTP
jgi:hypothetical protein